VNSAKISNDKRKGKGNTKCISKDEMKQISEIIHALLNQLKRIGGNPGLKGRRQAGLVVLLIGVIGLSSVGDSGVSWDEPTGVRSPKWNYDLITKKTPIERILFKYDGTVFNFASEALFQIKERVSRRIVGSSTVSDIAHIKSAEDFRKRFELKHIVTFLTSLIAYLCVAVLVGELCGYQYSWFGPVCLLLIPRFWGHAFFNFKDVPFASVFTLSTLMGSTLVDGLVKQTNENRIWNRKLAIQSVLLGVVIGLLVGIRAGALVVAFFPWMALVIVSIRMDFLKLCKRVFWIMPYFVLTSGTCFLVSTLCYPSSWENPIGWFPETLQALSKYGWTGSVLFAGEMIPATALPRSYIPIWFIITVPAIIQLGAWIGLIMGFTKYGNRFSVRQKAIFVLVLLQLVVIPLAIVARRSIIYDEIRHVLFIMPSIAVLSACGFIWAFGFIGKTKLRTVAPSLVFLAFFGIAAEMYLLHPYEYVYFNPVFGGLKAADRRFETDYWGLSMRNAMEWINSQKDYHIPVVVAGPRMAASVFAEKDVKTVEYSENQDFPRPFYYLALSLERSPVDGSPNNRNLMDNFPECPVLYRVERSSVALSVVKKCDYPNR